MPMHQAADNAALKRLEPFVGEWNLETSFPDSPVGRSVFEWILDGQFLVQRSEVPHPDAPDGFSIVGPDPDGDGYTQHYFDSRGVVRLYAMTFRDGVWTLSREKADFSPLPFSQRFNGTFSDDGRVITARWESSEDGANWELDFELTYTKVG
jgi:hypothetical protein